MQKRISWVITLLSVVLVLASLFGLRYLHPGNSRKDQWNPQLHKNFSVSTIGCPSIVMFDNDRVDRIEDEDEECRYTGNFTLAMKGVKEVKIRAMGFDGANLDTFVYPSAQNRYLLACVLALGLGLGFLIWRLLHQEIYLLPFWLAGALWRTWTVFISVPAEANIFSDMWGYMLHAQQILDGEFKMSHFFQSAGLNGWLALHLKLGGGALWTFKLSQLFLSLGSVVLVYLIAKRVLKREWMAVILTTVLALFNAQNIWFAGFALAEPIYGFLMLLSFYLLLRAFRNQNSTFWLFNAGAAFMLAFYMKGIAPFVVIFFSLWVFWQKWKLAKKITWLASFATGCLAIIAIHATLSYSYYGKPVISSSAGGLNFVEGKCPWKDNSSPSGRWHSPLFNFIGERAKKTWSVPFSDQAYYWKQGIECVKHNPSVLPESFRYIYYVFFGNPVWPISMSMPVGEAVSAATYRIVVMPGFILFFLLGWSRFRKEEGLMLSYFLGFFLTMWLFKSEARFRIPFDGLILVTGLWGYLKGYAFLLKYIPPIFLYKPRTIHPTLQDPAGKQ
jgi:4-amino-4-deoxy-L-arabinose transferase and related glycosyltransferases of PMT family